MNEMKPVKPRSIAMALAAVVAAALALSATVGASASSPAAHRALQQAAARPGGGTGGPLLDHGGNVLPASQTYAIWWGDSPSWAADVQSGIESFLSGLDGSSYLGDIATQYMRGGKPSTGFVTSLVDATAPTSKSPPVSTIVAEVSKVLAANSLTPDAKAVYFVFTANFPAHAGFCGWHAFGSDTNTGTTIQVAYMPNISGIPGCDPGNLFNLSGSEGLRSLANISSHEYMEAITDPDISAWFDSAGAEIGDKCAFQFSAPVSLGNGKNARTWQLQEEWSNADNGCIQS